MLIFIIILSCLLFLASSQIWKQQIHCGMSPTCIYALVWGGIWTIHQLGFMDYRPVSDRSVIYSALPLLFIFVGEFIAFTLPSHSRKGIVETIKVNERSFHRWILILGGISLFSGAIFFLASYLVFGHFWQSGDLKIMKNARTAMGISMYSGSFLMIFAKYSILLQGATYSAAVLGGLYLRLVNSRCWYAIVLPLFGAILFDLSRGSRSRTYDVLIIYVLVYFFVPLLPQKMRIRKKKKGKVLVVVVLLLLGGFVMNMIGVHSRETKYMDVNNYQIPFSLVQFIDYNAGNLISFDQTLDDNELTWGRLSFWGIEQWGRLLRLVPRSLPYPTQLIDWEMVYIKLQPDFWYKRSLNTYSWLRYLYSDFGVIGLIILPFILGFISTRFAVRWVGRLNALPALTMLTLCYFIILRSPGSMMFRNEVFVFGVGLLYFASRRIVQRSHRHAVCHKKSTLLKKDELSRV